MAEYVLSRVREAADLGLPVTLTRLEVAAVVAEVARLEAIARSRVRTDGVRRHAVPKRFAEDADVLRDVG